jgi:hypothetical protein
MSTIGIITPHVADLIGWARIAAYQMIVLGVAETIGNEYGPLLKPSHPRLHAFIAATWRIIRQVANKLPMKSAPSNGPTSKPPAPPPAVLAALLCVVWLPFIASTLQACSGTQVQQGMRGSDAFGLAANRAAPLWLAAMRTEGRAAADAACTDTNDPVCVRRRLDAVHAVVDRWVRVRDQWEMARVAHDRNAECLEAANRADGGVCPDPDARSAALAAAVLLLRCELRAVGHPELDVLGTGLITCPAGPTDGRGGYN